MFGYTAAWKQVSDHSWETANKLQGKLINTDYITLSADGKTLTIVTKGVKPDGTAYDDETVYKRESGKEGLAGKWRNKQVKVSAPGTMEISENGSGGLRWRNIEYQTEWNGKLDGNDYPATGPAMPKDVTLIPQAAGTEFHRIHDQSERQGNLSRHHDCLGRWQNSNQHWQPDSGPRTDDRCLRPAIERPTRYSPRSATAGSTRIARRAGIQLARAVAASRSEATPM